MQSTRLDINQLLDTLFHGKMDGFYLEIGAWDAKHLSQSYHLEQLGWKGLCVDPFPKRFERRKCEVCNKAISSDGKPREFVKVTIDRRHGGDVSYFSGFRDSLNLHFMTIMQHCDYDIVEVDTITISKLYEYYNLPNYIDFLSVDVEGAEIEVFCGIDLEQYRFGVIMFEHNMVAGTKQYIAASLERNGYRHLLDTDIESIFVSEEIYAQQA
jgi:FkbM family methyltransferase